jgi:germination protein M
VATRQTTVFLPRLFDDDSLRLAPVGRAVADSDNVAAAVLDALIQGPNGDERAADFEYALDRRTRVLGVSVRDGTAMADFGAGLERVHGRPFTELVYWSIVYTLTEAPGVQRVELHQNGAPLTMLGDPPFTVPPQGTRDQAPDWARPR